MSATATTPTSTEARRTRIEWGSKLRIGLDVAALLWPIVLVYSTFRLVEFRVTLLEKQVEAFQISNKEDHDLLIEIRTKLNQLIDKPSPQN